MYCRSGITNGANDTLCDENERCAEYEQTSSGGYYVGTGFNCIHERYCGVSGELEA